MLWKIETHGLDAKHRVQLFYTEKEARSVWDTLDITGLEYALLISAHGGLVDQYGDR